MQPHRARGHPGLPYFPPQASGSAAAAQAVAAALSNPYGQNQFAYPQASHYAQAYAQYYSGAAVTPEGYTISSTYVPGTQYNAPQTHGSARPQFVQRSQTQPRGGAGAGAGGGGGQPWYQPGTCRCTQRGCSFAGSKKAVEIHMMDRHLVYPPGWEHRQRKNDWDADPSLKGKPIPIQGTSIRLDTPEAIAEWIAERKKRFPTAQNVAEKQQKMREAVERGQLPFDDGHRRKRRRTDDGGGDGNGDRSGNFRGRGGQRGRGRGRGRGRAVDGGWEGRKTEQRSAPPTAPIGSASQTQPNEQQPAPANVARRVGEGLSDGDSSPDSDSDGAPEVVSSKAPPGSTAEANDDDTAGSGSSDDEEATPVARPAPEPLKKPRPKQPRKPLHNPFAQRPSLLRNLLLPEIRMTVSNLSQAIRFLVDNDFLDNVELKPGQANERMIEVIGEQHTTSEGDTHPTPGTAQPTSVGD